MNPLSILSNLSTTLAQLATGVTAGATQLVNSANQSVNTGLDSLSTMASHAMARIHAETHPSTIPQASVDTPHISSIASNTALTAEAISNSDNHKALYYGTHTGGVPASGPTREFYYGTFASTSPMPVYKLAPQNSAVISNVAKPIPSKVIGSVGNLTEVSKKSGIPWWLWLIAAAIAAFFLFRSCAPKTPAVPKMPALPAVVAPAVVAPTAAVPASVEMGNWSAKSVDGKWVIEGAVKDQAAKDSVINAAKTALGEANVVDKLTLDDKLSSNATGSKWADVFGWLKGSPKASLAVAGASATLSGQANGFDAKQLGDWLGAGSTVTSQLAAAPVVPPAPVAASCNDKALAADVEFVTGGAAVKAASVKVLQALANNMAGCAALKIEIAGHTDNVGNPASNMALSQARARSVMAVLVKAGVAAERMVAKGYGDTKPVGDNATVEGKQKNRRVEFVAQ
jgi:OmpA-OmpF porin, OOP family